MSADQNRKNKKSFAEGEKNNRGTNRAPVGPNETDQSLHKPYHEHDEQKISRPDNGQPIGEFSDWRKTG